MTWLSSWENNLKSWSFQRKCLEASEWRRSGWRWDSALMKVGEAGFKTRLISSSHLLLVFIRPLPRWGRDVTVATKTTKRITIPTFLTFLLLQVASTDPQPGSAHLISSNTHTVCSVLLLQSISPSLFTFPHWCILSILFVPLSPSFVRTSSLYLSPLLFSYHVSLAFFPRNNTLSSPPFINHNFLYHFLFFSLPFYLSESCFNLMAALLYYCGWCICSLLNTFIRNISRRRRLGVRRRALEEEDLYLDLQSFELSSRLKPFQSRSKWEHVYWVIGGD